jgi:hypothetical protein
MAHSQRSLRAPLISKSRTDLPSSQPTSNLGPPHAIPRCFIAANNPVRVTRFTRIRHLHTYILRTLLHTSKIFPIITIRIRSKISHWFTREEHIRMGILLQQTHEFFFATKLCSQFASRVRVLGIAAVLQMGRELAIHAFQPRRHGRFS